MSSTIVAVIRRSGAAHCVLVPWSVPPVAPSPSETLSVTTRSEALDAIQMSHPKLKRLSREWDRAKTDYSRRSTSLRTHRGGRRPQWEVL